MTDRPRKEPLPLEALDDPPAFPPAARPPNAPTKPIDYAPPPAPAEPSADSLPDPASLPTHSPSGSTTKPVAYVPEKLEDSERDARGYPVQGFSPKYRPEDSVSLVELAPRKEFRGAGDRAREHLHMRRGKVSAWPHVVAAFLMEAVAFAAPAHALAAWGASEAGLEGPIAKWGAIGVAALFGLFVAWAIFRDRWRTIEAFSSRFALEPAGLALLWVPAIAWGYATIRGLRKLFGR